MTETRHSIVSICSDLRYNSFTGAAPLFGSSTVVGRNQDNWFVLRFPCCEMISCCRLRTNSLFQDQVMETNCFVRSHSIDVFCLRVAQSIPELHKLRPTKLMPLRNQRLFDNNCLVGFNDINVENYAINHKHEHEHQ
jgi:hypothetical protein